MKIWYPRTHQEKEGMTNECDNFRNFVLYSCGRREFDKAQHIWECSYMVHTNSPVHLFFRWSTKVVMKTSEKFSYLYDMQNGGAKLHHDIKIMSNINVQDSWREWKETR